MRKRKINQELLDLLRSGRWNDFTVSELKAAYMGLPNCSHLTEKAAWQYVYRNVLRMERRGLLSRLTEQKGEKTRYRLVQNEDKAIAPSRIQSSDSRIPISDSEDATIRCLQEKLHHYKVEMLSAIGETEEYDAICKELPHMRSVVQSLYNEARDRCTKILGRVRALESILSNQLQLQQSS